MEEVLLTLLSALPELLFEILFQVVIESIIALILKSVRSVFEDSNPINPMLAAAGYLLVGSFIGFASLFTYPHPLFHPTRFHGVSLLISPLITGLLMSQLGRVLRRRGKQTVRIESFGYGFAFAMGWALVRFIGVR
jgi:hypothetical protein